MVIYLSQFEQHSFVVEVVFTVGQRDHSVGVLVQLELDRAVDLHLWEVTVDHLGFVFVSDPSLILFRPHSSVPEEFHNTPLDRAIIVAPFYIVEHILMKGLEPEWCNPSKKL